MQFEVQKSVLLKAIADTNGAVEKKNTIPVLQNIKILYQQPIWIFLSHQLLIAI